MPVAAIYQLGRLLAVTRRLLPRVHAPTLLLQGRRDPVVPRDSMSRIAALLGSADVTTGWLERSGHLLPLDAEADAVAARVAAFVATCAAAPED